MSKARNGRLPQLPSNLVSFWLMVETSAPFRRPTDALAEMNSALSRRYRIGRIREMERGDRMPEPDVERYMRRRVLPNLFTMLVESGIAPGTLTAVELERINDALSLPPRTKDKKTEYGA